MMTFVPPYQETITVGTDGSFNKAYRTNRICSDLTIYIISKEATTGTIQIRYGDYLVSSGDYTTSQKIVHKFADTGLFPALSTIEGTSYDLFDINISITAPAGTQFIILILGKPVKEI